MLRLTTGVTPALESHHVEHRSTNRAGRSHFIHERTGRCAMAKYSVGSIVQLKTGGIHGLVDSQLEPESDHPKAWIRWDDGTYQIHYEHELRPATVDEPKLYKKLT